VNGIAPRVALFAALCWAVALRAEQGGDGIDWQRGVIKAMGRGAPDLNAPSIAVARAAAEKAALAAAHRNALRILEGAALDDGLRVETVLRDDGALRKRVEGKLRGVRAAKTRYFTDGGVWLDIEVPFKILPPRIAEHLRPPSPAGAEASPAEPRAVPTDGGMVAPDGGTLPPDGGTRSFAPDAGTQNLAPDGGQGDAGGRPR